MDRADSEEESNDFLREIWSAGQERTFLSSGGHTRETALRTTENKGGLVAFGRLFVSNVRPGFSRACCELMEMVSLICQLG